jgi:hypothetical protein
MFRIDVQTLEAYFAFDPKREADLRRLDALITKAAPSLKRYLRKGTPAGEPGMRPKRALTRDTIGLRFYLVKAPWPTGVR